MLDQSQSVSCQYIRWIAGRIARRGARAMRPQIGHDEAEAALCDFVGMAELDPVGLRIRKEAVQQQHGPPLAELLPGKLDAVERSKGMSSRGACQRPSPNGRPAAGNRG